ncbi:MULTISPECIES: UDP-2,3-diacylglucosamine diphosphatase [unclassified Legionella]|uniref:UDP-2,3-diacylglucosamine diphosphatase n=1 Tax=unclassified Legionella TaxID=2622702 RepID=UPI001055DC19|nr:MULTISPECIES: UDP-2,3-diacylglucosamine diphosphatase [unclassified Legionella]MDI9818899.1 UDP-2,3-diacylglucosamine diphosphatase [Legionella sp. PL877]
MLDAVFISDLHLHPDEPEINARFNAFIDWASESTQAVYILGDFFHVWPGDDGLEPWSQAIAERLYQLSQKVSVYYLHGNRDFLLGNKFASLAGMRLLSEPLIIQLDEPVLLVHGDRYCIKDKGHQWLRRVTRNTWFPMLFLRLPFKLRYQLVNKVRQYSQTNKAKSAEQVDVVPEVMIQHMQRLQVNKLIHGHTHKPGLRNHQYNNTCYQQYVLSDWDDVPQILCYDKSNGFKFVQPCWGSKHG